MQVLKLLQFVVGISLDWLDYLDQTFSPSVFFNTNSGDYKYFCFKILLMKCWCTEDTAVLH